MSLYGADINNAFSSFIPEQSIQQQIVQTIPPPQPQPQPLKQKSTPIDQLRNHVPPQPTHPQLTHQQKAPLSSRREIIKIVSYSLVILFALSLYSVFVMLIKEIVIGTD